MKIGVYPRLAGVGGMVSFHDKLIAGLIGRGISIADDLNEPGLDSVLVIGGGRRLDALVRLRRRGVRIVQRLDGMNWLHRTPAPRRPRLGLRHALRAEYGNLLLALIRARLADAIVYQSDFSRRWWEREHGPTRPPCSIVYNGVDLDAYHPAGPGQPPADRVRLLLVEGSLMGGYEQGLEAAFALAASLADAQAVELYIVGRVGEHTRAAWTARAAAHPGLHITWAGLARRDEIPAIDRSAHLLYSADLNAACPNSVIEALACGLPVLAFATGALPELVTGDAGRVASYGGDPWQLDPPDIPALAAAAGEILAGQARFRPAARARAEEAFGLDAMLNGYLNALAPEGTSHA